MKIPYGERNPIRCVPNPDADAVLIVFRGVGVKNDPLSAKVSDPRFEVYSQPLMPSETLSEDEIAQRVADWMEIVGDRMLLTAASSAGDILAMRLNVEKMRYDGKVASFLWNPLVPDPDTTLMEYSKLVYNFVMFGAADKRPKAERAADAGYGQSMAGIALHILGSPLETAKQGWAVSRMNMYHVFCAHEQMHIPVIAMFGSLDSVMDEQRQQMFVAATHPMFAMVLADQGHALRFGSPAFSYTFTQFLNFGAEVGALHSAATREVIHTSAELLVAEIEEFVAGHPESAAAAQEAGATAEARAAGRTLSLVRVVEL